VLDVGCRDGMLTSFFAPKNDVTGIDIDRKALEIIEERLSIQTRWVDCNSEWPFEKDEFDVIVACEIMEHLYSLEGFLDSVCKSLKPKGLFLGSVPNSFRMRNRWKFLFGKPFENDPTHVRMFSYDGLKDALLKRFKTVEIVPLQGKILPIWPVGPSAPKRLNRLFAKDLLFRAVTKEI